mgnify:FL=1
MPQQYKIDKVAEIESRIAENAGLFVVNYNGLTVKQAQELRHQLRECGAEMKVYKNNLVKIALKNQEQPELDEILAGPVAYVFYESEPVEAAKALKDFSAKSKGVLEIKGGISDGKAVSADDVKAIAELPPRISFSARSPVSSPVSLATSLSASTAFPLVSLVRFSRSPSRRQPSRCFHPRRQRRTPGAFAPCFN